MTRKIPIKEITEQKRKVHSLTLYVIFSFLMLVLYTVIEMILSTITGISHDTLTTCFFVAFGIENVLCAGIKISKIINKETEKEVDEYEVDN